MLRSSAAVAFVFVGAVLLFSLEPLVGRLLLPLFGGAFHVWTTALMFFQGALFCAYLYAHLLTPRIGRWHLAVVALPLLFLPPEVGGAGVAEASTLAILTRLSLHVAVPFGVLATTAVVTQRWLADAGREPWGLYAVSNLGSLGALLLYAIVIEPQIGLRTQRWVWAGGYVIYVGLAWLAWRQRGAATRPLPESDAPGPRPRPARLVYWLLLSAAPSAFLMAVTNLVALEVGNVPLVWVLPLAIYLASFVVAFATPRAGEATRVPGAVRRLWPHVAAVGAFFFSGGDAGGGWIDVLVHYAVLAFVTLAAHGELHRARPAPKHLTLFYLVIALGGWLGGAFVALVAPAAFTGLWEYPLALAALALTMGVGRRAALAEWVKTAPKLALIVSAALVVVILVKIAGALSAQTGTDTLAVRRSFYGIYRVTETGGRVRDMMSGSTRHGRQRVGDLTPLSYYHPAGPLGDALTLIEPPRHLGVVGLGVGAAAGHLEPGDRARFYEIDPAVVELARAHFTYLSGARGEVELRTGDARLSLERDDERFDLLFIDAFSGDAIPTHLLTREALALYMEHLAPDGVLLLHVSNRYYDLRPALRATLETLSLPAVHVARVDRLATDQDPSQYVAVAGHAERLSPLRARGWSPLTELPSVSPWTDDHANVIEALSLP